MRRIPILLLATWLAAASTAPTAFAQTDDADKIQQRRQAMTDAHRGDFDYLLGDWEFTATNKQYGEFRGYWSAMRLDGGQILDEYRVVDEKGETYYATTTIRAYNSTQDRWELIGMDSDHGGGLQDFGTGKRDGAEMRIEQRFGVAGPHPSFWRIRYSNIRPDRFSWSADRSLDDGKTWTKDFQRLEARRIGPARHLDPLTKPAKKTAASDGSGRKRAP